ncbi:MAG: hypothetical protein EOS20_32135 [Mesorhizobium sp.]|uniref:hypothetical protein n=1 Tax=Mesorhizobium sp. TaxID=1871066 RepID=UPI000FE94BDB|nr:hypothetical protein [Mesorhizobium sp.]RWQ29980.1 MAG: hypothetical protein EOS20_32135 [Mesorhizobium sp.]
MPLVVGIHVTPDTGLSHVVHYLASGGIFCRLVTFDRQGYGGSTPEPGRKVLDVVPVVRSILDYLETKTAGIYGHMAAPFHSEWLKTQIPNASLMQFPHGTQHVGAHPARIGMAGVRHAGAGNVSASVASVFLFSSAFLMNLRIWRLQIEPFHVRWLAIKISAWPASPTISPASFGTRGDFRSYDGESGGKRRRDAENGDQHQPQRPKSNHRRASGCSQPHCRTPPFSGNAGSSRCPFASLDIDQSDMSFESALLVAVATRSFQSGAIPRKDFSERWQKRKTLIGGGLLEFVHTKTTRREV